MDNHMLIAIVAAIAIVIGVGITILIKALKGDEWVKTKATVQSVMQTSSSSFGVEHANISFQRNGATVYSRIGGLSTGHHMLQSGLEINIRYKVTKHFGTEFYQCFLEDDADELIKTGKKASSITGAIMILVGMIGIIVMCLIK